MNPFNIFALYLKRPDEKMQRGTLDALVSGATELLWTFVNTCGFFHVASIIRRTISEKRRSRLINAPHAKIDIQTFKVNQGESLTVGKLLTVQKVNFCLIFFSLFKVPSSMKTRRIDVKVERTLKIRRLFTLHTCGYFTL